MNSSNIIIQFTFLKEAKIVAPSNGEFKINLLYQGEKLSLNKNYLCEFKSKYPKDIIYYRETIGIIKDNDEFCSFDYLLYINKVNNIVLDLDEKEKPSIELLFYAKSAEFIPRRIQYKDKEFKMLDTFGNKRRGRIFLANIDPSKLDYINSETFKNYGYNLEDENTYQAVLWLVDDKTFEVSLTNMDFFNNEVIREKKEKIRLSQSEIDCLGNLLKEFYEKYINYCDIYYKGELSKEDKLKYYNELNELSEKIVSDKKKYDFFEKIEDYEYEYEYQNENLILNLFHIYFYLKEYTILAGASKSSKLNNFDNSKKKVIEHRIMEKNIFIKLSNDKALNIKEKIGIIKTIIVFLNNSLLLDKKIFGVNYINIYKMPKDSPYKKSNNLLKNIISELTEDSRLFEAFIYFDSEIIQNILEENKQKDFSYKTIFGNEVEVKQPKYMTEYGLNLMTLDAIKAHLLSLLPKIIIQIDTNINIRALYENKTKLMVINEFKLFANNFNKNEIGIFKDEPDSYIVPISMEILHELCGHAKLRNNVENEKESSPLVVRDSKNNFKPQKLFRKFTMCDDKEELKNKGETGKVLELYISDNPDIIRTLKEKSYNKKINEAKYWTDNNFDNLYEELDMGKKNVSNFQDCILVDDYDPDFNYDCLFGEI